MEVNLKTRILEVSTLDISLILTALEEKVQKVQPFSKVENKLILDLISKIHDQLILMRLYPEKYQKEKEF